MESWFMSFLPNIFIMLIFSVIPMIIGIFILYFVIKLAVKNALKEHKENN